MLKAVECADLSSLSARSPALEGFDWTSYLTCSVVRLTRVLRALRARVPRGGRVLDCGSYFGNFSLMLAQCGYQVDALDAYQRYGGAFAGVLPLLGSAGVSIRDLDAGLEALPRHHYDAALAMGVIEHIPHSPRGLLFALDDRLKEGGWLLLDTPNLAYLYTREKLRRGESIFYPLAAQWRTEEPFEGHHREYTIAEVEWMLDQIGHRIRTVETFNYSYLSLADLEGEEAARFREMQRDPALREVIFSVSRRT